MLRQLTIQNFALVPHLDIALDEGLTVITGESGAGKSILLDALGLVLGDRARNGIIRPGAARSEVTAQFDLSLQPTALQWLESQDLTDSEDPNLCLLRRVVSIEGRSRAFVNGSPVTLGALRQVADTLVEIHGQQDHQRIADRKVQLAMLDDFGTSPKDKTTLINAYRSWQRAERAASAMQQTLDSQTDRAGLLTYQLEELHELNLGENEFSQTESDFKRLSQAQQLRDSVQKAQDMLEDNGARFVTSTLSAIDDNHSALAAALDACRTATALLEDASADLRHYEDSLQFGDDQLPKLETRLHDIHELSRKHRVQPESLFQHIQDLVEELNGLETDRAELTHLQESATLARGHFEKAAARVSKQRKKAAPAFASAVSTHLETLGIRGGSLTVNLTPVESEQGLEAAEFLVTTNPNYPPGTLSDIASGGEQTRINLAIAIVAAEHTALPCLVLDEADVGVGGTTADVIGRLLRSLATHTQVICITHAPQVAALGQHHFRVIKSQEQDTGIEPLTAPERIEELARMLAGADVTEKTRDYASTLLTEATVQ